MSKLQNKLRALRIDGYHWMFRHSNYVLFKKLRSFTMIALPAYSRNLDIAKKYSHIEGCIVECGTWRGGMIAGISALFKDQRECFLFDSFEGLPEVTEKDGDAAKQWQQDTSSPWYWDNCRAEMEYAEQAMKTAGSKNYHIVKGWFNETLPKFDRTKKIAILRLDGDWYDSTMQCLENLYDLVQENGVIIVDDYYNWTGCARAIHDFFSKRQLPVRIRQWENDICYIEKISYT